MTDKMGFIYSCILQSLDEVFGEEYIDSLFDNDYPVDILDVADAIMIELIKNAYFQNAEKHSVQHHIGIIDYEPLFDSIRMKYSRLESYVQKYRDLEFEGMRDFGIDEKDLKPLKATPMNNMTEKLEGHKITEMGFFERNNIHDLHIIKSIVERRIVDSKKISNNTFISDAEEYDKWVNALIERSHISDEDLVFCSLAFFTFEWKFCFEVLYLIADKMAELKVKNIDFLTLLALCGYMKIPTRLGYNVFANSRMVKERQFIIPELVIDGEIKLDSKKGILRENYVEKIALITDFFCCAVNKESGKTFKDTFTENTDMDDWASFFYEYDIFEAYHKKEWTNQKIRNMRSLYDKLLIHRE